VQIQYRVASRSDVDLAFSLSERNFQQDSSEVDRMMAMWKVRWRKEAITHYFNTGWSFVATVDDRLVGYFMAQPFIHFRGQTQTVWVEHIESESPEVKKTLIEIVIKVSREKHMQRVLFSNEYSEELQAWNASIIEDQILEVKTTKG
jgi:hypothetical protein